MKQKVGILTWHYYPNFGSALQAYALQRSVQSLGYDTEIVNYRDKKYGQYSQAKQFLQACLHQMLSDMFPRFRYPFQHFQQRYLKETRLVQDQGELEAVCRGFDCIVCGSDQIWAPNVLNPMYLLCAVPAGVRKVSYAASIGLNEIPDSLVALYKDSLSKFHAVSVRESVGAGILQDTCQISTEVVLDPTLLLSASSWQSLEHPVRLLPEGKFIFCYFLKKDHHYDRGVRAFAQNAGLQIIGYSANDEDEQWMSKQLRHIGPREFLWLIHHAEAVITDSYHGTIFSLLYHKKFITIERFQNSETICQNSRIYQLQTYFGLHKQIITSSTPGLWAIEAVDYEKFERELSQLRLKSNAFLENALRS